MDITVLFSAMTETEKEEILQEAIKWKGINYISESTSFTPIETWIKQHPTASLKLKNSLRKVYGIGWRGTDFSFIEEVTKSNFLSIRYAGIGTWNEFVKLRGY